MKKFSLLSFALIAVFLQTNALYSQTDWTKYTPVPCDDPMNLEWDGPHEYQICYGESDLILCENCCYKIIYYDNLDNSNYPPQYKISVVGIYWEGIGCQACDKEDIIRAL